MFNSLVWGWINKMMGINYRVKNNYAELQKTDGALWLLLIVRWKGQDKCRYHTEYKIEKSLIPPFHCMMWTSVDWCYLKSSACQINSKGFPPHAGHLLLCNHPRWAGKQTILESFEGVPCWVYAHGCTSRFSWHILKLQELLTIEKTLNYT